MPGIIQRTLLEKIEKNGYVIISDVKEFRRSSVARAALQLLRTGTIESWTIHINNHKEKCRGRPPTTWITVFVRPRLTDEEFRRIIRANNLFCHEMLKNNQSDRKNMACEEG